MYIEEREERDYIYYKEKGGITQHIYIKQKKVIRDFHSICRSPML